MTTVIHATSVDEAIYVGMTHMKSSGQLFNSRNGKMIELPGVVVTDFSAPRRRVSFNPVRDANPFFHLFESLWMLAGRNDVEFPATFAKNIRKYSDDGLILNGAYGHRWRWHFGYDQLKGVILRLKIIENDRRAVLQMWDGYRDLRNNSKDLPCNMSCVFKIRDGVLDMTVYNRSNDMVWGAYGANVVHFSMLMEYVAASVGCEMGVYTQVSNSMHIYPDVPVVKRLMDKPIDPPGVYGRVSPWLFDSFSNEMEFFNRDLLELDDLIVNPNRAWRSKFFMDIVKPMSIAWTLMKEGIYDTAISQLHDYDWHRASIAWIERRM